MISTMSNQGTMRWMIVDGKIDTSRRIEFLERLIQDAGKKVSLVLDNLRLLQQQPERIKSYFQDPRVKYAAEHV